MCYGSVELSEVQRIVVLELYSFMKKVQKLLKDNYEDFESLDNANYLLLS